MNTVFLIVSMQAVDSLKFKNIFNSEAITALSNPSFEVLELEVENRLFDIVLIEYSYIKKYSLTKIKKLYSKLEKQPLSIIYSDDLLKDEDQIELFGHGADGILNSFNNPDWVRSYLNSLLNIRDKCKQNNKNEQKYRQLFETMFSAYALHEIITDENGNAINYRFLEVNPAFERITGLSASKVVGKTILDVFPETKAETILKYGEVALNGIKLQFEQYSDEHKKFFEVIAFCPEKRYFSTIFTDVTAYKEAIDIVKKSEKKLEKLNATKDKFFSIIAHDLINPFQAIIGFADLLVSDFESFDKDELKHTIEQIKESSENAYNLLINLLEWSRLQGSRLHCNPEKINMSMLADQEIKLLQSQALAKDIHIRTEIGLDCLVIADKNMISTVLRNLISNAIKFSKAGDYIKLSSLNLGKFIQFSVYDEGVGISPDNLDKLFKPDQQVRTLGTAKEKGTGLGLTICKEFIEKNKGRIWAESKLGFGSSFHFILPAEN